MDELTTQQKIEAIYKKIDELMPAKDDVNTYELINPVKAGLEEFNTITRIPDDGNSIVFTHGKYPGPPFGLMLEGDIAALDASALDRLYRSLITTQLSKELFLTDDYPIERDGENLHINMVTGIDDTPAGAVTVSDGVQLTGLGLNTYPVYKNKEMEKIDVWDHYEVSLDAYESIHNDTDPEVRKRKLEDYSFSELQSLDKTIQPAIEQIKEARQHQYKGQMPMWYYPAATISKENQPRQFASMEKMAEEGNNFALLNYASFLDDNDKVDLSEADNAINRDGVYMTDFARNVLPGDRLVEDDNIYVQKDGDKFVVYGKLNDTQLQVHLDMDGVPPVVTERLKEFIENGKGARLVDYQPGSWNEEDTVSTESEAWYGLTASVEPGDENYQEILDIASKGSLSRNDEKRLAELCRSITLHKNLGNDTKAYGYYDYHDIDLKETSPYPDTPDGRSIVSQDVFITDDVYQSNRKEVHGFMLVKEENPGEKPSFGFYIQVPEGFVREKVRNEASEIRKDPGEYFGSIEDMAENMGFLGNQDKKIKSDSDMEKSTEKKDWYYYIGTITLDPNDPDAKPVLDNYEDYNFLNSKLLKEVEKNKEVDLRQVYDQPFNNSMYEGEVETALAAENNDYAATEVTQNDGPIMIDYYRKVSNDVVLHRRNQLGDTIKGYEVTPEVRDYLNEVSGKKYFILNRYYSDEDRNAIDSLPSINDQMNYAVSHDNTAMSAKKFVESPMDVSDNATVVGESRDKVLMYSENNKEYFFITKVDEERARGLLKANGYSEGIIYHSWTGKGDYYPPAIRHLASKMRYEDMELGRDLDFFALVRRNFAYKYNGADGKEMLSEFAKNDIIEDDPTFIDVCADADSYQQSDVILAEEGNYIVAKDKDGQHVDFFRRISKEMAVLYLMKYGASREEAIKKLDDMKRESMEKSYDEGKTYYTTSSSALLDSEDISRLDTMRKEGNTRALLHQAKVSEERHNNNINWGETYLNPVQSKSAQVIAMDNNNTVTYDSSKMPVAYTLLRNVPEKELRQKLEDTGYSEFDMKGDYISPDIKALAAKMREEDKNEKIYYLEISYPTEQALDTPDYVKNWPVDDAINQALRWDGAADFTLGRITSKPATSDELSIENDGYKLVYNGGDKANQDYTLYRKVPERLIRDYLLKHPEAARLTPGLDPAIKELAAKMGILKSEKEKEKKYYGVVRTFDEDEENLSGTPKEMLTAAINARDGRIEPSDVYTREDFTNNVQETLIAENNDYMLLFSDDGYYNLIKKMDEDQLRNTLYEKGYSVKASEDYSPTVQAVARFMRAEDPEHQVPKKEYNGIPSTPYKPLSDEEFKEAYKSVRGLSLQETRDTMGKGIFDYWHDSKDTAAMTKAVMELRQEIKDGTLPADDKHLAELNYVSFRLWQEEKYDKKYYIPSIILDDPDQEETLSRLWKDKDKDNEPLLKQVKAYTEGAVTYPVDAVRFPDGARTDDSEWAYDNIREDENTAIVVNDDGSYQTYGKGSAADILRDVDLNLSVAGPDLLSQAEARENLSPLALRLLHHAEQEANIYVKTISMGLNHDRFKWTAAPGESGLKLSDGREIKSVSFIEGNANGVRYPHLMLTEAHDGIINNFTLNKEDWNNLYAFVSDKYNISKSESRSTALDSVIQKPVIPKPGKSSPWQGIDHDQQELYAEYGKILSQFFSEAHDGTGITTKLYTQDSSPVNSLMMTVWTELNGFKSNVYITANDARMFNLNIDVTAKPIPVLRTDEDGTGKSYIEKMYNLDQTDLEAKARKDPKYKELKDNIVKSFGKAEPSYSNNIEDIVKDSSWRVPVSDISDSTSIPDGLRSAYYDKKEDTIFAVPYFKDTIDKDTRNDALLNAFTDSLIIGDRIPQKYPHDSNYAVLARLMNSIRFNIDGRRVVGEPGMMSARGTLKYDRLRNDPRYVKDLLTTSSKVTTAISNRAQGLYDGLDDSVDQNEGIKDSARQPETEKDDRRHSGMRL